MEWISAKDEMPPEYDYVIIRGGVGYIRHGEWWTVTGEQYPGKLIQWPVTHWMPLPQPPEKSDGMD